MPSQFESDYWHKFTWLAEPFNKVVQVHLSQKDADFFFFFSHFKAHKKSVFEQSLPVWGAHCLH